MARRSRSISIRFISSSLVLMLGSTRARCSAMRPDLMSSMLAFSICFLNSGSVSKMFTISFRYLWYSRLRSGSFSSVSFTDLCTGW
ncbi:hypothetical protein BpHYR1_003081 [Brachionus plicatilis]|uniref:Uncharacterized protein n=1 Tax=Brachionus plicatilis TaxID=10195 RepID=A0A3M7QM91_BRAPC|nr:hypothetical protein BpHYR1_003081 [Brachionus plicatilis]